MPIKEITLPFIHPVIDISDLHSNNKLFTDHEILSVKNFMENKPNGRYRKSELKYLPGSPKFVGKYGMLKDGNDIYAIYKGIAHNKQIYNMGNKKVKLVQDLTTGEWLIIKIEFCPMPKSYFTQEKDRLGEFHLDRSSLKDKYNELKKEFINLAEFSPKLSPRADIFYHSSTLQDKRFPGYSLTKVSFSFLMPLLPGMSLLQFIHQRYKLPMYRWVEIGIKILEAVREVHQKGLLHCDLKVENIMYDFLSGDVTIVDLLTMKRMTPPKRRYIGPLIGTDIYMAPEFHARYKNQNDNVYYVYDEYTETYAVGVVLKILFGIPVKIIAAPGQELSARDKEKKEILYGDEHGRAVTPELVKILNAMTHRVPLNRQMTDENEQKSQLVLDGSIKQLKGVYKRMLASSRQVHTAIIEIDDILNYFHDATELQKERLFAALTQVDEICIVSFSTVEKDYYGSMLLVQNVLRRIKNDDNGVNLDEKITYHKNLLVMPDVTHLTQISPLLVNRTSPALKHPERFFTYIDASLTFAPYNLEKIMMQLRNHRYLLSNGINVITAERNRTKANYIDAVQACAKELQRTDYHYIVTAMRTECNRLHTKYSLQQRSSVAEPEDKALARYRHERLKETFDAIARAHNIHLSYAAITVLLQSLGKDPCFSSPPASFFARRANCVANVDEMKSTIDSNWRQLKKNP
jgi:serine/threonine protein kinase